MSDHLHAHLARARPDLATPVTILRMRESLPFLHSFAPRCPECEALLARLRTEVVLLGDDLRALLRGP